MHYGQRRFELFHHDFIVSICQREHLSKATLGFTRTAEISHIQNGYIIIMTGSKPALLRWFRTRSSSRTLSIRAAPCPQPTPTTMYIHDHRITCPDHVVAHVLEVSQFDILFVMFVVFVAVQHLWHPVAFVRFIGFTSRPHSVVFSPTVWYAAVCMPYLHRCVVATREDFAHVLIESVDENLSHSQCPSSLANGNVPLCGDRLMHGSSQFQMYPSQLPNLGLTKLPHGDNAIGT